MVCISIKVSRVYYCKVLYQNAFLRRRLTGVAILFSKFKWYYVTRLIGAAMTIYGILVDKTPDRGTIIMAGVGILGLDKVTRSEK